jgi:hypothetical protein
MRFLKIAAFLLVSALISNAQLPVKDDHQPMSGAFAVSVDDACTIYVNGDKKYSATIGQSRSPELQLSVGDRVVVELRNDGDGKHFMLAFVSSDQKTIVSFKRLDFKIVPSSDVTDFTAEQFQSWTKTAKEEKGKRPNLGVKSSSERIWGDLDKCTIAALITPQMITKKPE